MVILQERLLGAAAVRTDKRALAAIALKNGAADRSRDVARIGRHSDAFALAFRRAALLPQHIFEQQPQRAIDDARGIAVRDGVAQ